MNVWIQLLEPVAFPAIPEAVLDSGASVSLGRMDSRDCPARIAVSHQEGGALLPDVLGTVPEIPAIPRLFAIHSHGSSS
jgi:hypothetical protein